jgi:SHS2 domain-containing protein
MKRYETIDISGDAGIRGYGETIEQAFANTALGMYSLITDPEGVKAKKTVTVSAGSESLDGLLVSWLNELIFHFDTYGFVGKEIVITAFGDTMIVAVVAGEDFDPERHDKRLLIKAATYHQLRIEETDGVWAMSVVFDI